MIIKLEKDDYTKTYGKEFVDAYKAEEYDKAFCVLKRFYESVEYNDFHLAAGILYLLMTDKSDDLQYFAMAYQELLMHIERFPNDMRGHYYCIALLLLMQKETPAKNFMIWSGDRGIDVLELIARFNNVKMYYIVNANSLISALVYPRDFGALWQEEAAPVTDDYEQNPSEPKLNKVIKFGDFSRENLIDQAVEKPVAYKRNNKETLDGEELVSMVNRFVDATLSKHGEDGDSGSCDFSDDDDGYPDEMFFDGDEFYIDDVFDDGYMPDENGYNGELNDIAELFGRSDKDFSVQDDEAVSWPSNYECEGWINYHDRDLGDDIDDIYFDNDVKTESPLRDYKNELDAKIRRAHIHRLDSHDKQRIFDQAMAFISKGDLREADGLLCNIKDGDHQYYCSLFARALIAMNNDDNEAAEELLKTGVDLYPEFSLGAVLLCDIYAFTNRSELIEDCISKIDISNFISEYSIMRAFNYVLRYCPGEKGLALLQIYIKEYNYAEMRLLYAQRLFNDGKTEAAKRELFILTQVFYMDYIFKFYYEAALYCLNEIPYSSDIPAIAMSNLINGFIDDLPNILSNDKLVPYGHAQSENQEELLHMAHMLFTLEYRNSRKLLFKMFNAVRAIAVCENTEAFIRDQVVSPLIDPLVKAIGLGEIMVRNPKSNVLTEFAFVPSCEADLGFDRMFEELSKNKNGICYAYVNAAMRALAYIYFLIDDNNLDFRRIRLLKAIQNICALNDYVAPQTTEFTDCDFTYYLVKTNVHKDCVDQRLAISIGFESKAAAERGFKKIKQAISQNKR